MRVARALTVDPVSPLRLADLTALAVPPRCLTCRSACAPAEGVCPRCRAALDRIRPVCDRSAAGADLAVSAGYHDGVLRRLDLALKYRRHTAAAILGAELMCAAAPAEPGFVVVPVPAAPLRRMARGFDPAEELAICFAAAAGLTLDRCLTRSSGPRQVGRRRRERLADPPRIRCSRPAPARAMLIDDIRTTGATAAACSRALRGAGCRHIVLVTLAVARLSRVGQERRIGAAQKSR